MSGTHQTTAREAVREFSELIRYSVIGYLGGLLSAVFLDSLGFSKSGLGQWIVRTLSGEGESILEGLFAVRKKLSGAVTSLAQAYGWGKLFGMAVPWVVDGGSRLAGLDVYGISTFYIPFFYAMSDQVGANISGFLYFRRNSASLREAWKSYSQNPVMISGLGLIFIVPVGLFVARLVGFSPETQTLTAIETILANLCWIPPLIGWYLERQSERSS